MWYCYLFTDLILALNTKFENTFDIKVAALETKNINTAMKTR
jgi:hypothetical protein